MGLRFIWRGCHQHLYMLLQQHQGVLTLWNAVSQNDAISNQNLIWLQCLCFYSLKKILNFEIPSSCILPFIKPALTLLYSCIDTDELKWDRSCQHTAQPDGCIHMSEAYLCSSAQGHLCTLPSIKCSPLGTKSLWAPSWISILFFIWATSLSFYVKCSPHWSHWEFWHWRERTQMSQFNNSPQRNWKFGIWNPFRGNLNQCWA